MPILNPPTYGPYVDPMRIAADKVRPFVRELTNAAPRRLSRQERRALEAIGVHADRVDALLMTRQRTASVKVRPTWLAFINNWGAIGDLLLASGRLSSDRGARATELYARLFPNGLVWVREIPTTSWGHATRILQRIEDEGLGRELDQIIGADARVSVQRATSELGDAIGVGRAPRELTSMYNLQDELSELSRAVGFYGRQLAAAVDESDAKSIERFMRAVSPIDAYRSRNSTSREPNIGSEPPAPITPTPPALPAPSSNGTIPTPSAES